MSSDLLGAIIFVISFFGCCGASKESKCMMYTYGFFLFIILIAQVNNSIDIMFTSIQNPYPVTFSDRRWYCSFCSQGGPERRYRG